MRPLLRFSLQVEPKQEVGRLKALNIEDTMQTYHWQVKNRRCCIS